MSDNNLRIRVDENGNTITDDDFLNQIIKSVEDRIEAESSMRTPMRSAVTFDDDPEEKRYLILLTLYPDSRSDTEDSYRDWSIKTGRQSTYDYLKEMIIDEIIDPNLSFVIAGNTDEENSRENFKPESNPITVFRFMKVMFENRRVLDDGESFCIDDYISYDWENGDKTILEI